MTVYLFTLMGRPPRITRDQVLSQARQAFAERGFHGTTLADIGARLGVSEQLTFKSTNSAGWYDLVFSSPLKLAAGNYWIGVITGATSNVAGFRYDSVAGSRALSVNTYASGPTNPFGSFETDDRQTSLYATYTAG